ncbi:MAG: hypothetical protein Q9M37_09020 [Desulfonauticus sp.]|nr:hypothetical protein [Desulfonauticus sp.]
MRKNYFKKIGLIVAFVGLGLNMAIAGTAARTNNQNLNNPPSGMMFCPWRGYRSGQQISIEQFTGTLKTFLPPIGIIKTSDSKELYIRIGPWWFWQQQGYNLQVGEKLTISGYKWGNYIVPVKITTSKGTIVLRDQYGFPVWRYRGRGKGIGRGRDWQTWPNPTVPNNQ